MGNLIYACTAPYLGAVSFGYMIGYSSPALPSMLKDGIMSEESGYWFGSLGTLGAMFGCPLAGWMMEKQGRKGTLLFSTLPFLVGWILIGIGSTENMLHLGRVFTGFSSGIVTVVAGVYVAETAPKEVRGMFGSGVQLGITIGILLVYSLGLFLDWQALAWVGSLPAVAGILITLRIPDTPRYYLVHNQRQNAVKALSWLRKLADVEEECSDIEESLPNPDDVFSWSEFTKPQLLRPLQVSLGIMIFQQFSGINVVMFYTVSIFKSAGFKQSELATVLVGAAQVVSTVLACILMDRAGRPKLLTIAGIGMAASCFMLSFCYYSGSESLSNISLLSLILYIVSFSLGWGPIPMLIMSEVFPVRARGPATAIASVTAWFGGFIVTLEYNRLQSMLGQHGAFAFFGICCVIGVVFVKKMVPETKGKSLEDIELYFLGRTLRQI